MSEKYGMFDEFCFDGICPHCGFQGSFKVPAIKESLAVGLKGFFQFKQVITELLTLSAAKIGKCPNCQKILLECPFCDTIDYRESNPAPCKKCGKRYRHP